MPNDDQTSPPPATRRPRPGPGTVGAGAAVELTRRPRPGHGGTSGPLTTIRRRRRWRRSPSLRAASIGAIVAGVALFAAAGAIIPLAGADQGRPDTPRAAGPGPASSTRPTSPITSTPASAQVAAAPTRHSHRARVTAHPFVSPLDRTDVSALAANGIPSVALNAYRVAAARIDHDDPSCDLHWSLLAGIGRVESDHGQFGGAVLHADGLSTPEIIGPALNGKGTKFVPAPPDGLALDGDAKYAHALGPMQFIPSTWAIYGADADGDGVANVFDINDAALGTARYLCAAGGDLATGAARVRAVFAYNHLTSYVDEVLALAHAYYTGTPIRGIPLGNTTGGLPSLGHGKVPPANPGGPPTRRRAPAKTPPLHLGGGSPTHSPSPSPSRSHTPSPTPSRSTSHAPSSSPSPTPPKTKPTKPKPTASPSPTCTLLCLP